MLARYQQYASTLCPEQSPKPGREGDDLPRAQQVAKRDEAQHKLELTEQKLLACNLSATAVENDYEKCKISSIFCISARASSRK